MSLVKFLSVMAKRQKRRNARKSDDDVYTLKRLRVEPEVSELPEEEEKFDNSLISPWIEKYGVLKKSQLAVDSEALEKIGSWLQSWKKDIKDGKSRKFMDKKKKPRSSDSDFVTSEEEGSDLKTKCLVLHGPTGCGKTTTITTLAKKMGFKVVEVNFSTARPGKEVLKQIEEATLSHRLESSKTCLVLFKDICLFEPKEDVGFAAAVAQLITSSCRPIVMTMTAPTTSGIVPTVAGDCDSLILDSKIEKKEPLFVYFGSQPTSVIVQKVLLPIVRLEYPDLYNENDESEGVVVKALLDPIARYCKGDIRHSVNQLQVFIPMFNDRFSINNFEKYLSPYIDLDFVRRSQRQKISETCRRYRRIRSTQPDLPIVAVDDMQDESSDKSPKHQKNKELVQEELKSLKSLVQGLNCAIDLDQVTTFLQRRSHANEMDFDDDIKTNRRHILMESFTENMQQYLNLAGDSCTLPSSSLSKELSVDAMTQENGTMKVNSSETDEFTANNDVTADSSVKSDTFKLSSFIFDDDVTAEREQKIRRLINELEVYITTEGALMSSGQFNYHSFAFVRTIIKGSKLHSVGPWAKRNRRLTNYFNRLSADLVDRICDTFDFQDDLNVAKQSI